MTCVSFCWSNIFWDHRFGTFREVCWICWSPIITHLIGSQDGSSQSQGPKKWSPWRFPPNHSLYWENGSRGPPFTFIWIHFPFRPKKYGWMVNWWLIFSDFHGFPPFPHRKSLQNPAWKEAWKLSVSRPVLPQVKFTVDLLLLVGRNPIPKHRLGCIKRGN